MSKFGDYSESTSVSNGDYYVLKEVSSGTTKKVQAQNMIPAGSIGSTDIATNGVAAANLATSAITLGYAQITTNFSSTSTTAVQVTGLTLTVTIPAGGRKVKITVFAASSSTSGSFVNVLTIWDGTVGSGTQLAQSNQGAGSSSVNAQAFCMAIVAPSAGSKTYNVGFYVTGGTGTLGASSTQPAILLVEAI